MIESLTVPLEQFDLYGFIEAFRKVARKWVSREIGTDACVLVMEKFDYPPVTVFEGRELVEELVDRGWKLFFRRTDQPPLSGLCASTANAGAPTTSSLGMQTPTASWSKFTTTR